MQESEESETFIVLKCFWVKSRLDRIVEKQRVGGVPERYRGSIRAVTL